MLIAITGISGSGKSTQIELLNKFLEKNKYPVFISKAYGKAEESFLAPFFQYWDSLSITFIFQGLHRQQYVSALKALKEGRVVIADRWDETFLSFHSKFGFLAKRRQLMHEWNELAFSKLIPDLTFFIDITPQEAHKRLDMRGRDFLDEGSKKYYAQIRRSTLEALKGRNVIVIDGLKPIGEIHKIITDKTLEIMLKNKKLRKK